MHEHLSRRTLLQSVACYAASTFGIILPEQFANAQGRPPYVRSSAHSPQGKAALISYRKAVSEMEHISKTDRKNPIGWLYQYKIHQYPDNWRVLSPQQRLVAKEQELDTIFGAGTAERALAKRTLGSCHGGAGVWDEFWPWHRMYVFFFEQICRQLSGDQGFALPYWGYDDGQPSLRTLPEEFRNPVGKAANSLWHERRMSMNDNQSPDEIPETILSKSFLAAGQFLQAQQLFESTTHGNVHVFLGREPSGQDYDMREVGASPRDPVFWLHHCECDRMWEYWLSLSGHKNENDPAWLENGNDNESGFLFVDNAARLIKLKNGGVLDTKNIVGEINGQMTTFLGYVYDQLPAAPAPSPPLVFAAQPQQRRTITEASDLVVRKQRSDVDLNVTTAVRLLEEAAPLTSNERQVVLKIANIEIAKESAASIGIYLDLPPNVQGREANPYLVDVISTFGLGGHGAGHGPTTGLVFDITQLVLRQQKSAVWRDKKPRLSTLVVLGELSDADLVLKGVEIEIVSGSNLPPQ